MAKKRNEYPQRMHDAALLLYARGVLPKQIAQTLGVNRSTIFEWKKKEKWEDFLKEVDKLYRKRIAEDIISKKDRQMKLCDDIIRKFKGELKKPDTSFKPNDILQFMKHELHLMGEPEQTVELKQTLTALFKDMDLKE